MRKKLLVCIVMFVVLLVGCGQQSKSYMNDTMLSNESAADTNNGGEQYGMNALVPETKQAEAVQDQSTSGGQNQNVSMEQPADVTVDVDTKTEQKLIRTLDMDLETEYFDDVVNAIKTIVKQYEGYVERDEFNNYSSDRRSYYVTLRIPQKQLDIFLNTVNEMSNLKIRSKSESTEDITLKYYDAKEYKNTLEVERERILEILKKADNLKYIIQLEDKLSQIRYEISSYESQIRLYDNMVNYSTVNMNINEVEHISMKEDESVGQRMKSGLSDSIYSIKTGVVNFSIWFVANLPFLILFGVLIFALIVVVRRIRHKHNGKDTTEAITQVVEKEVEKKTTKIEENDENQKD